VTAARRTGGATHPARPLLVAAGAAVVTVLALTACASPREQATDAAAERVRASAEGARGLLQDLVSAPDAPRGQALLDQVRERFPSGPDVITFDEQVRSDGAVALRTAFHARGESGGGLSYEAVVVRLCVELTAAPGPPPAAEVRDTQCPPSLPSATGNAGNVDTTVTLEG
jgi:hypothetical protein